MENTGYVSRKFGTAKAVLVGKISQELADALIDVYSKMINSPETKFILRKSGLEVRKLIYEITDMLGAPENAKENKAFLLSDK